MENRYNNIMLGFYLPAFFYIEIATDEKLENLDLLPDKDKSTLYHEYVHFLQDLTTTFGLTNIINSVDIQKAINAKIRESKTKRFEVPISYESYYDVETYSNLNSMFFGDYESSFSELSFITSIDLIKNEVIANFEDKPYIQVNFLTGGKKDSFAFGALAIMESMAYLIESCLYDNVAPPMFPYRIVEKIIEFEHPTFSKNPIDIVMLCDYTLNTPDPGRFLIEFLRLLKLNGITEYQDFYKFLKMYKFSSLDKDEYTVFTLFEKRSQIATEQLKGYFTDEIFSDINNWISILLSQSSKFKLENFNFWVDVLSQPTKEKRRNAFNHIIGLFGYPLLSNNRNEISFSHPEIIPSNIIAFKAINEVRQVMMNKQTKCKLYNCCKNGIDDITNEDCVAPWKRGNQDPLCPFGQIIKMWGIHEVMPINY